MKASFEKVALASDESFRVLEVAQHRFGGGWHFHPEVELTLITESRGIRFIGDNASRFEQGDLLLVGPNLPHCWISDAGENARRARAIVVQFHPHFLGEHFSRPRSSPRSGDCSTAQPWGSRPGDGSARSSPSDCIHLPDLSRSRQLISLLSILDLLAGSRELKSLATPTFRPRLDVHASDRIDRVYQFLLQHFQEPIRLAEVARIARMAPAAFCRNFRRDVGRPLFSVLNEIRIGHACKLLSETARQISEICFESGFGNLSHFNRQFLRVTGLTPRQYRNKLASSPAS